MKLFILLFSIFQILRCHCPHMMGMKMADNQGPSAPSILPPGDKGWDYDDDASAPGSVPKEHFIQTTIIHRSSKETEKKYAVQLISILKQIKDRLKTEARITIDNENIDCSKGEEDHYRCSEYPQKGSYHFLIVEDSLNGAAVYSIDKKYNEENEGKMEMALLDALSRHSPNPLIAFASRNAEKEVGFVRHLDTHELSSLARPPTQISLPELSPFELKLIEPSLLELRHGEGLDSISHQMTSISSQKQFDEVLQNTNSVFVLFWSNVHSISLHTFNMYAQVSNKWNFDPVLFTYVDCHLHADFCEGMRGKDFQTIVAYRDGVNVGSTDQLGDLEYYTRWMKLVMKGPLLEAKSQEDFMQAKKGSIIGTEFPVITVGVFPDTKCTEFNHFSIVAERLMGRYAMVYHIKEGGTPALATYIPSEKKKRNDFNGKLDPSSLISFITTSSLPNIIDISLGFTTEFLFKQPRSILCYVAPPTFNRLAFEQLAGMEEAKKQMIFVQIVRESNPFVEEVFDRLFLEYRDEPRLILFNKYNVHILEMTDLNSMDELWTWVQNTEHMEPEVELSPKDVHPLRLLQISQVNDLFGKQNTVILPDHTLFDNSLRNSKPTSEYRELNTGGGCPFMAGASHDEL